MGLSRSVVETGGLGASRAAGHRTHNRPRAERPVHLLSTLFRLRASVLWALGLLFVSALPSLRAHDPYECWASAVVRPDHMELAITMAQSTALRLIDPELKIRGLSLETFPQFRAQFEKAAAALCILTTGRKPLAARQVQVELTEENDIAFKVIYPRPPAGRLHFHAAFLAKLGPGYGGILEATDTSGNHLGWEQLSAENPNYEVTVLALGKAPPKKI